MCKSRTIMEITKLIAYVNMCEQEENEGRYVVYSGV